jgi:hypothetical protein
MSIFTHCLWVNLWKDWQMEVKKFLLNASWYLICIKWVFAHVDSRSGYTIGNKLTFPVCSLWILELTGSLHCLTVMWPFSTSSLPQKFLVDFTCENVYYAHAMQTECYVCHGGAPFLFWCWLHVNGLQFI